MNPKEGKNRNRMQVKKKNQTENKQQYGIHKLKQIKYFTVKRLFITRLNLQNIYTKYVLLAKGTT